MDDYWSALGLTEEVLEELYRRARGYAANCIQPDHRDDAIQEGMCRVLLVVSCPPSDYPEDPEKRLNYLTSVICNRAKKYVTRTLPPDMNIPAE